MQGQHLPPMQVTLKQTNHQLSNSISKPKLMSQIQYPSDIRTIDTMVNGHVTSMRLVGIS